MSEPPKPVQIKDALRRALERQRAGDLRAAEDIYRRVLSHAPGNVDALQLLGATMLEAERPAEAARLFRDALAVRDDLADIWSNYAVALGEAGRADEARQAFDRALALDPDHAPALSNSAGALFAAGFIEEAILRYRRVAALRPGTASAWRDLGFALAATGAHGEAAAAFERAVRLEPRNSRLLNALGSAYTELGRFADARRILERALAIEPDDRDVRGSLAVLLEAEGKLDEAEAVYDSLLERDPDAADLLWNRGLLKLKTGSYPEGFRAYLIHDRIAQGRRGPVPRLPPWQGEDLKGKSITVTMEQGLGDMVQFVRFVPMLAAQGANVTLESYEALFRLFEEMPGVGRVLPFGSIDGGADFHVPMMRLPYYLGITFETLPADVPYLAPPADTAARVPPAPGKMKVGFVWSSNPGARQAGRKSCRLDDLAPLLDVDGVAFYSLQVGPHAAQLSESPYADRIFDLAPQLMDLSETAAAIRQLDLVVTIDTVVAHLAGALGARVWTILPFVPDWRWMLGRPDSPWYPTMRLFRQRVPGDWDGVVNAAVAALRECAQRA